MTVESQGPQNKSKVQHQKTVFELLLQASSSMKINKHSTLD